jgi:hypothetical protein
MRKFGVSVGSFKIESQNLHRTLFQFLKEYRKIERKYESQKGQKRAKKGRNRAKVSMWWWCKTEDQCGNGSGAKMPKMLG